MNFEDYQYLFKFVLIGDTGVGKSCFLSQYVKGIFIQEYDPTIGLEFESKSIEFNDGIVVQNQLWDTSGSSQFMAIQKTFCQNAAAAIIFYKIDNQDSFKSLDNWINILKQVSSDKIQTVIVATHKDLEEKRQVETEQGRKLADSIGAKFFEISNQDKDQIDVIVNTLSFNVLRLISSSKINPLKSQYGVKMSRQQEQQYASQQTDKTDNNNNQQQFTPIKNNPDNIEFEFPKETEEDTITPNKATGSPKEPQQKENGTNQQNKNQSRNVFMVLIPIIFAYGFYFLFI
ncbi:unnamed protein product (macronuclear) [Paramecium tetraurelia]|uniref:Uncharacterized protein n=1 Tax=Paramecium tetraurelia TaxID=5888 RepID=A0ED86_PARTE|nr:uncharacterized protein GSPATT00004122001 [Paramecium tetraurelia]CAK93253.1 unnamed protein product [Paramecium tetraurelia]|eukprot:XP_001460650.1 hypothetical protein (macronuclear) [Paramecium tetraurelia strain d4-2]